MIQEKECATWSRGVEFTDAVAAAIDRAAGRSAPDGEVTYARFPGHTGAEPLWEVEVSKSDEVDGIYVVSAKPRVGASSPLGGGEYELMLGTISADDLDGKPADELAASIVSNSVTPEQRTRVSSMLFERMRGPRALADSIKQTAASMREEGPVVGDGRVFAARDGLMVSLMGVRDAQGEPALELVCWRGDGECARTCMLADDLDVGVWLREAFFDAESARMRGADAFREGYPVACRLDENAYVIRVPFAEGDALDDMLSSTARSLIDDKDASGVEFTLTAEQMRKLASRVACDQYRTSEDLRSALLANMCVLHEDADSISATKAVNAQSVELPTACPLTPFTVARFGRGVSCDAEADVSRGHGPAFVEMSDAFARGQSASAPESRSRVAASWASTTRVVPDAFARGVVGGHWGATSTRAVEDAADSSKGGRFPIAKVVVSRFREVMGSAAKGVRVTSDWLRRSVADVKRFGISGTIGGLAGRAARRFMSSFASEAGFDPWKQDEAVREDEAVTTDATQDARPVSPDTSPEIVDTMKAEAPVEQAHAEPAVLDVSTGVDDGAHASYAEDSDVPYADDDAYASYADDDDLYA
jgi:hypothetical protein